jgi:hypothetical protein
MDADVAGLLVLLLSYWRGIVKKMNSTTEMMKVSVGQGLG